MLVFGSIFLLIILLMILPIFIRFELKVNPKLQEFHIGFSCFKNRYIYKFCMPLKPKDYGLFYINVFKKHTKRAKQIRYEYFDILSYVRSKSVIEDVNIKIQLGLDEAGKTAIYCGILITICDFAYRHLHSKFKLKTFKREISPIFNKNLIDVDITCIMSMRTGYIIIVISKLLCRNIIKAVKHRCQTNIQ